MKIILQLLSCLYLFTLVSCSDPCKDIACGLNGACDEGTCICEPGYSGTNCEVLDRDAFLGDWQSLNWICDFGMQPNTNIGYVLGASENGDELLITTPNTPDLLLVCKIDGNALTIEPQTLIFGIPVLYSGFGTLSENSLSLTMTQETTDFTRTCTGDFFK